MKKNQLDCSQRREALYGLEGKRLDAYDAIVRPDRVFPVRLYTLRRWAPIMGPTGFWLLVTMQQLCYQNPKGGDWCTISRARLAEKAAVSEATVHRYLHSEQYGRGLCHWIQTVRRRARRWSVRAGKFIHPPNRYHVVMDVPLARVDQRGIAQLLQDRGAVPGTPATAVEPMLEELAERSFHELMELCEEAAGRFTAPVNWNENEFYPTVAEVMTTLGVQMPTEDEETVAFREKCSQVQQAFVGRTHLGTQYFRHQWVPVLGHKLALAVLQLRARCFWNENETRDEIPLHFTTLAREAGCSARWLRTINETHPLSREFFSVESQGRGKDPIFRVTLLEPIAPQDQETYEALLRSGSIVPETGQLSLPQAVAARGENGTDERARTEPVSRSNVENGTDEQVRTEGTNGSKRDNGTGEQVRTEPVNGSDARNGMGERVRPELVNTRNGTGEPHVNTVITIINTHDNKTLQQKHLRAPPPAVVSLLLRDFGIGPPNDKCILDSRPDPEDVRAWMLYAITEPGLQNQGTACGYVVNRLMANDQPPARFRCWAQLTPVEWRTLWRAGHYGGPYVARAEELLSRFQQLTWSSGEALDVWQSDFGSLFPRGPFGDGRITVETLTELVNDHLYPPGDFHLEEGRHTLEIMPSSEKAHAWLVEAEADLKQLFEQEKVFHDLAVRSCPTMEDNTQANPGEKAAQLWQAALDELKMQVTQATFDTLLHDSKGIELKNSLLVVAPPSLYAKEWLESRLLAMIERTIQRMSGGEARGVQFEVLEDQSKQPREGGFNRLSER